MSRNVLNEATVSVLFNEQNLTPASAHQDWAGRLGIKNALPFMFPTVAVSGYSSLFGGNLSTEGDVNWHFADNVTWIKGTHTLQAGFEFRPLYFFNQQPGGASAGNFLFNTLATRNPALKGAAAGGNSVASLLLGIPSSATLVLNPHKFGQSWQSYSTFVQDRWKVSPTWTLTYGLRWDVIRAGKERHNRRANFDLETMELRFAGEGGYPETYFDSDLKRFAPRLGLAYSPNRKISVRIGYGRFYLPVSNLGALTSLAQGDVVLRKRWTTADNGITFPLTLAEAFPVVEASRELSPLDDVLLINRHYKSPVVDQWNLSVQREILPQTVLDLAYVGNKGTHLPIPDRNLNQVPANLLGPGDAQARRPFPTRGSIISVKEPVGNSIYHAMQLKLEHRGAKLNLLGWYTFGKSIDDASGIFGFRTLGSVAMQDDHNLAAERSISTFDRTHTAVISGNYDLPFGQGGGFSSVLLGGWQVNGILTLRSGVPLSMFTAQNLTGSLGGGSRPNRLRSGVLPSQQRSIEQWFDVGAFVQPDPFTFGNTSRTEPDLRGPGTAQLDFSLFRNVPLSEEMNLQIRVEAFNTLNRVNFNDPNTRIGSGPVGTITGAADARIIQLGMRFTF